MEALFRQFGIYSHVGQLYEPVDSDTILYYREATDGQILEEGITEAGSMSSYIAAGTAHSSHGLSMIPFFIYYSMFGFQRIGDLIWAAGDMRCRGFLLGGTAGRTTLAGEGLQHQDGNSHLYAMAYPSLQAYDPAYAYEMAVIVLDGIRRMFYEEEDIFYYLTLMNENYEMPILPHRLDRGHLPRHLSAFPARPGAEEASRAAAGQRGHPPRGPAGPGNSRAAVRRLQQRLQRDQLQGPLPGRPRVRALEPAASRGEAAAALRAAGAGRRRGPDRGGVGLRQPPWRLSIAPWIGPDYVVLGRRRFRPQRGPQGTAAILRGRCREHRPWASSRAVQAGLRRDASYSPRRTRPQAIKRLLLAPGCDPGS